MLELSISYNSHLTINWDGTYRLQKNEKIKKKNITLSIKKEPLNHNDDLVYFYFQRAAVL